VKFWGKISKKKRELSFKKEQRSMAEATIFVDEATSEQTIQQIEHLLKQLDGIERILVDTADGEVKIEFNDKKISKERIIITLQQHNFHIQ
jgi:copper chaperone CopZ